MTSSGNGQCNTGTRLQALLRLQLLPLNLTILSYNAELILESEVDMLKAVNDCLSRSKMVSNVMSARYP